MGGGGGGGTGAGRAIVVDQELLADEVLPKEFDGVVGDRTCGLDRGGVRKMM